MLQAVSSAPRSSVVLDRAKRFRYQAQDCPLTLRQGIAEYLQGHPGVLRADELSAESAALFRSHDVCHVVFGLDTTPRDEVLADCWTIFGTDVGLRRYVRYLRETPEAKELFRAIGYGKAVLWTPVRHQGLAAKSAHVQEMAMAGARVVLDTAAECVARGIQYPRRLKSLGHTLPDDVVSGIPITSRHLVPVPPDLWPVEHR